MAGFSMSDEVLDHAYMMQDPPAGDFLENSSDFFQPLTKTRLWFSRESTVVWHYRRWTKKFTLHTPPHRRGGPGGPATSAWAIQNRGIWDVVVHELAADERME